MREAGRSPIRSWRATTRRVSAAVAALCVALIATSAVTVLVRDGPEERGGAGSVAPSTTAATRGTAPAATNAPGTAPPTDASTEAPLESWWRPDTTWVATTSPLAIPEGEPGTLDVVLVGDLDADRVRVPVIVRNATNDPVYDPEVRAIAHDDGTVVAEGSSQGARPRRVDPGRWALAVVHFGYSLDDDVELAMAATGHGEPRHHSTVDLVPTIASRASQAFVEAVTVGVRNVTDETLDDPVMLTVVCAHGAELGVATVSFHDVGGLAPGEARPVQTHVVDCPDLVVAATAWQR